MALKRHPLAAFILLTCLCSWWPAILYAFDLFPFPIAAFGPFLAAVIVLAITQGRGGVTDLLRRMLQWRVGIRWYTVALLLPIVVAGSAAALNVALGAERPTSSELADWPVVLLLFPIMLLVPGFGGAWEEPGWRGYLLPRLLTDRSPLGASLAVGGIHAVWHLPLFLTGDIAWPDVGTIVAVSVVFTWLMLRTGGSVLIAMMMHAMNNAMGGEYIGTMFSGADSTRQAALSALLFGVAAVIVIVVAGPAFRGAPRQSASTTRSQPGIGPASARNRANPDSGVAPPR